MYGKLVADGRLRLGNNRLSLGARSDRQMPKVLACLVTGELTASRPHLARDPQPAGQRKTVFSLYEIALYSCMFREVEAMSENSDVPTADCWNSYTHVSSPAISRNRKAFN
jgi:hypothetical protein